MIQPQTYLNVADNSGARKLMCIRIIGASNRRYAHIGDVIVAVIKEAIPNTTLERSIWFNLAICSSTYSSMLTLFMYKILYS